ncbi:hypothetical protein [Luteimonas suaedae]|uniref:hypothetical protein n=1 Tax=Luteimonas suaedae TaxID=2605430 RepID=UPI0011F0332E|nr:hypothetical protein [Luteimonas suaedae]
MLRLIVPIACLLLAGCKFEAGLTTVNQLSIEGRAVNATRSTVTGGEGEFECLRSVSGRCHYVLFVDDCVADAAADAAGDAAGGCGTRVVHTFTLSAGERQHLEQLPRGLRQCVDHDVPPVAPDCAGASS